MQYMHISMHVQFKVSSSSPTIDSHRTRVSGQPLVIGVIICSFSSSAQNIKRYSRRYVGM